MNPLAIDLFCGLGGWTEGLLAEGWNVVGFDNERHVYGEHQYPAQLVLQDVLTIHGSQFKNADLIVASPPCQEYSYMAMPWSRAKQIMRALKGEDEFPEGYSGSRTVEDLNALFDACFRIQREASQAKSEHIPIVIENVRGAQKWVGRSRWNHGSYHLWGDVPALMPMTVSGVKVGGLDWSSPDKAKRGCFRDSALKNPGFRFDGSGKSFQSESVNSHIKNKGGSWFGDYQSMKEGVKQSGDWFNADQPSISRMCGSKSSKRKLASALIAKIPLELARHIASVYKPREAG